MEFVLHYLLKFLHYLSVRMMDMTRGEMEGAFSLCQSVEGKQIRSNIISNYHLKLIDWKNKNAILKE